MLAALLPMTSLAGNHSASMRVSLSVEPRTLVTDAQAVVVNATELTARLCIQQRAAADYDLRVMGEVNQQATILKSSGPGEAACQRGKTAALRFNTPNSPGGAPSESGTRTVTLLVIAQ